MTGNCPDTTAISLPFPPSVNQYWRHIAVNGAPRTIISAKGRKYRGTARRILQLDYPDMPRRTGNIEITVRLYPPDRRRRDLDNFQKGLWDAITGFAFEDDSQIKIAHLYMHEPCDGGRVTVEITSL